MNNASYFSYAIYAYDSDATAKAAGAIAKVNVTDVDGNACVGYVKTIAHITALSGEKCVKADVTAETLANATKVTCPKEFTFIVDKVTFTPNDSGDCNVNAGGRGVILKGLSTGTTFDLGTGRAVLTSSSDLGFHFENIIFEISYFIITNCFMP